MKIYENLKIKRNVTHKCESISLNSKFNFKNVK